VALSTGKVRLIDAVHVWLIRSDPPAGALARLAALLDEDEQRRAEALDPPRRARFVAAHGAARLLLGRHLGAPPERLQWAYGPHGKPELAGEWAGTHVSLSHSGDLAMLAISPARPVGVDIQVLPPGTDALAMSARYFPEAESRFVAAAGGPVARARRFVGLWARKEACVKAAGGRLAQGLRLAVHPAPRGGIVVRDSSGRLPGAYLVRDVPAPDGFRAAVALSGEASFHITTRWWSRLAQ
jgi:4'-phosphopantetheinyl transferase